MMSNFYIGATGIKTHSEGLQTVANNLSNVSTVGYKAQLAIFENLISQWVAADTPTNVAIAQRGMGSAVADIRTTYTSGGFEPGNSITDLAISGNGFFQVAKNGDTAYTRAGNFRFTATGYLENPNGYVLQGNSLVNGTVGGLEDVHIDPNDARFMTSPAKATSNMVLNMNLGTAAGTTDQANPFFSMATAWDANGLESPLPSSAYASATNMSVYDAEGNQRVLTLYFNKLDIENTGGNQYYEYVVGMDPAQDARTSKDDSGQYVNPGAGLLMSGVLVFNSAGALINQSAYVPSGGDDFSDLANLTPATLNANGLPSFTASFAASDPVGAGTVTSTLDFGLHGTAGETPSGTAADVGADPANLPLLATTERQDNATTAYAGSYAIASNKQDGYASGYLIDMGITEQGVLYGRYSNNQTLDLYRIPLFTFINPYGLDRAGDNLYRATTASGDGTEGMATEGGRGSIIGKTLETSNVDMAYEMVNMIVMQRGMQANSKVITTSDQLLNTAIQMKR